MEDPISWTLLAKSAARRILRILPPAIFKRAYPLADLERDIHIFLDVGDCIVFLPGDLQVPHFELNGKVINASPYLDVRVTALRVGLSILDQKGHGGPFASIDDWSTYELGRSQKRQWQCDFWLNEFQLKQVQRFLAKEASVLADVMFYIDSPLGTIMPFKQFEVRSLSIE